MTLPPDWTWRTLAQISLNAGDYGSGAAAIPFDMSLPRYVRVTDIRENGTLDPFSKTSISRADAAWYMLLPNDLLFARSGATVGKTYLFSPRDGEAAHAGYVLRFALNTDVCCPAFVAQWTRSVFYWKWVSSTFRQGAQPNINAVEYSRLPVPSPSVAEQTRIAAVLDTVDEAIAKTEGVIAKLKQVRAGLLHDLLTRGLDDHGQLRDPLAHPEQFQDSPLGRIPKTWTVSTVGDIVSRDRQGILTGPFGADLGTNDFVPQGIPLLQVGNVQSGYVDLADVKFISEAKATELARYRVCVGDLLFARSGATTGRNALADARVDGAIINYHIIRIAVDPRRCDSRFLFACFNSGLLQRQVFSEKGKGTREGINTAALASFRLPLPPLPEQVKSADMLQGLDVVLEQEAANQAKLIALKSGLMTDLLTCRVPVPEETVRTES